MDNAWLIENRKKLIDWQRAHYAQPPNGHLKLNIGSGHIQSPGYVNLDPFTPEANVKADARALPYADGTVDEISCHHALEHLPQRNFESALAEWVRVLKPGGLLDLGIPDIELCFDAFKAAPEPQKWNWSIYTIYGWQQDADSVQANPPLDPGQFHQSGVSRARLCELLGRLGMEILECFHYDAYDTPSVWVLARKSESTVISAFEQECVMGVFTHRVDYLPYLLGSTKTFLPHIPMLVKVQDAPIAVNMAALRQDFIASGKRYWAYLDDDIQFLNRSIIRDAIRDLVKNKWACVNVYSEFDPACLIRPYAETLKRLPSPAVRPVGWAVGYFILVDSWQVGQVQPDLRLPDLNTSVDTSYSMGIRQAGGTIGISGNAVYHLKKQTPVNQAVVGATNAYLMNKWGQFYFDHCRYTGNVLEWPLPGAK
jgi:SAM-dependent methyltransferase